MAARGGSAGVVSEFQDKTTRGFGYSEFPTMPGYEGGPLQVQESSLATSAALWIGQSFHRAHLSEEQVRELRNLLTTWLGDRPVVLMRDGETFEGDDVDVIDVTELVDPDRRGEWTPEDAFGVAARLRQAGYDSAAEEIEEVWG